MKRLLVIAVAFGSAVGTCLADEAIKLVPPANSTKETRGRNMHGCLAISQAIAKVAPDIVPFERKPLRGQETGRFLGGGRPAAEDDGIPIRYSSALGVNWAQSVISDRYVLCLLGLGYQWPPSIPSSPTEVDPGTAVQADRESTLLYNAGGIYRQRGVLLEAERLLRRSLEIEEKASGPEDPKTIRRVAEFSATYFQLGRYEEGLPLVKRLLPVASRYSGREKEFILLILDSYAKELRKGNQDSEAATLEAKAAELR